MKIISKKALNSECESLLRQENSKVHVTVQYSNLIYQNLISETNNDKLLKIAKI